MTMLDTQEPRSRIVVFRLTESEYLLMKKACCETRRSMSDFARSLVLSSIDAGEDKMCRGDLQIMGEQLSILSANVEALKGLVSELMSDGRASRSTPGGVHRNKGRSRL